MRTGAENWFLSEKYKEYKDARIGIVTSSTGLVRNVSCGTVKLTPTYELVAQTSNLTAIFAPEHGLNSVAQDGDKIGDTVDKKTGVKVYSLYGERNEITKEILSDVDVILFDIQDVGARFYTYVSTMTDVADACSWLKKKFIVLDRPNPITGTNPQGPLLEKKFKSFVGRYPIPTRYALTMGELMHFLNDTSGICCDLTVVECDGWSRDQFYDETRAEWISPSPNIPTVETCINYIGTCLFEGTNISEGRGTTLPFSLIGAPFINGDKLANDMNYYRLPGVVFRSASFKPMFGKHAGEVCSGVQLHITSRQEYNPFEAGLLLFCKIRDKYDDFKIINEGKHLVHLYGSDDIIDPNYSSYVGIEKASKESEVFWKKTVPYQLY